MIAIVIESAKKGKTEENHIKRIISYFCPQIINKIKFYKMAGKGELLKTNNYKMLIKEIETKEIKQILFLLDADDDFNKTKLNIELLIEQLNFKEKSDYFINCDPILKKGNLETFLLSTIDKNLQQCYSNFLQCLGREKLENYSEKNILSKLFEIENPPYDFSHKNFDILKQKITNLCKG